MRNNTYVLRCGQGQRLGLFKSVDLNCINSFGFLMSNKLREWLLVRCVRPVLASSSNGTDYFTRQRLLFYVSSNVPVPAVSRNNKHRIPQPLSSCLKPVELSHSFVLRIKEVNEHQSLTAEWHCKTASLIWSCSRLDEMLLWKTLPAEASQM